MGARWFRVAAQYGKLPKTENQKAKGKNQKAKMSGPGREAR
jgi:hypothetical protein